MASKPSVPQTPSKIPKLVAPTSTLSPRGRTPSFILGETTAPPASPLKVKRGLSSPRQPISYRVQGTPSTPNSPRLTRHESSIKSKSNDETIRHPGGEPIDALPDIVEDDPAITMQGGEGDMASPLAVKADPSKMKVKSENFSLKVMESRLACNSADVNVLYAANPIRMDSIVSVSTRTPPQQKTSPTYLDMFEQEAMESLETIRSMQDLGSAQNMSLEWDFTGGEEERHENFTQTSRILVETVDRASSAMPLPSFSKESLLDQQTTPLSVLDAMTTEEEGEEVSDQMSSYAYDCFAHEIEGEEEKYEFSPLITTPPAEEEAVGKIEGKDKPQSQFTPRCCLEEVRYQETSRAYESDDEVQVKEVFSLVLPVEPEQSTFLDKRGDGDGGIFMGDGTEELAPEVAKIASSSASFPRQRSSRPSQHVIAPEIAQSSATIRRQRPSYPSQHTVTSEIAQSSASFPRKRSSHPSQLSVTPEIAQSSASFPRQRSSRPSQNSVGTQKMATSSASVPQQQSSRSIYHDTAEPIVAQAQSTASIPQERRSSTIPLPEWQVENLKPKLGISASGGAIEIRPPPVQVSPDDLMNLQWRHVEKRRLEAAESKESASMFSAVQSRIILEQCSVNFGQEMKGSFDICNSTSFLQGFKVVANYVTKKDLKFTPKIGFIPPHGKVTVNVNSLNSIICTPNDAANYCVWVHMFRAFCTDVHELKEFYCKLEKQHPELIQTSQINNFIIWNNDDLPGMLEMINSVHDEMEREALMGEIHRHQSSNCILNESSLDRLESLQITMIKSNSNLKKLGRDLGEIRNGAQLFLFMALMIYGVMFILPYLHTIPSPVIVEPVAPPESDCPLCPSSWMPSWEGMQQGMNNRMRNTYDHIMSYF